MPLCRLYVKFSGPRDAWQAFDFTDERRRGRFITQHRRAFQSWVLDDECKGPPELSPPLHLPVMTAEVRAAMHGTKYSYGAPGL